MHPSFAEVEPGDVVSLKSSWDEPVLLFCDGPPETVFVTTRDVLVFLTIRQTAKFRCGHEFVFLDQAGRAVSFPTSSMSVSARRLV